MATHFLQRFFEPESIAVIGASDRADTVGEQVFRNLLAGNYKGEIYAVNPGHDTVQGHDSWKSVNAIGKPVDLAVIAAAPQHVPNIVRQCGNSGVKAAMVVSAGFGASSSQRSPQASKELLDIARHYGIRVLGPDSLGLIRPAGDVNLSFSRTPVLKGDVALICQSGALTTAILDWAQPRKIGFSAVVSMGEATDVEFGDVLNYLATDPKTRSILLYVEGLHDARRFLSGLRIAARMKPVIVVKAGRHREGSRVAATHTGVLVGSDDVFDAALARAGAVRAFTIEQLFSGAEVLGRRVRSSGNRLAIVSNGGGPAVLATDRAVELGLTLAELGPDTLKALDETLPESWSRENPVDLTGDADAERYGRATELCAADKSVDGVVAILSPQALSKPSETAKRLTAAAGTTRKPVLACWMGEAQVTEARSHFAAKHLPSFGTPEAAVEAFSYLAMHQRNQQLLMQVPEARSYRDESDAEGGRLIVENALNEGRKSLTHTEAKALLSAFGIKVNPTMEVHSPSEALIVAESIGFPVAMKLSSAAESHKSDFGGVKLGIASAQSVRSTFQQLQNIGAERGMDNPAVTIERMHNRPNGRELMVGVLWDEVFGPVIAFGSGGTMVEIIRDRAIALPPLNEFIARDLIGRTRIARVLGAYRHLPAADIKALAETLLRISDMVCSLPHIRGLDINPLIADESGTLVVDARIQVDYPRQGIDPYGHMTIVPYPNHLETHWQLSDGTDITIRPIRPEDAEIEAAFVKGLSSEAKFFRFMEHLDQLSQAMLVRFTQIDYDREMALIAVVEQGGKEVEIAVARYVTGADERSCEFAIAVADDWQGKGIASKLMVNLMEAARGRGLSTMYGDILAHNQKMLGLMRHLGFNIRSDPEDLNIKIATKALQ